MNDSTSGRSNVYAEPRAAQKASPLANVIEAEGHVPDKSSAPLPTDGKLIYEKLENLTVKQIADLVSSADSNVLKLIQYVAESELLNRGDEREEEK